MLSHERETHLQSLLAGSGRVVAKSVSRDVGVTKKTIRRDVHELAKVGRLKRLYRGAVPLSPANAPFSHRIAIANPEKIAIGRRAAQMVGPGLWATITPHSPNIAMDRPAHENLDIEIVGGRLCRHSIVTCGAAPPYNSPANAG